MNERQSHLLFGARFEPIQIKEVLGLPRLVAGVARIHKITMPQSSLESNTGLYYNNNIT
jgi:hypothetical protein